MKPGGQKLLDLDVSDRTGGFLSPSGNEASGGCEERRRKVIRVEE